jgi:hypothetical protein
MKNDRASNQLVKVIRQLAADNRALLEKQKENVRDLERPDFVWRYFLVSMSTWGRASGAREFIRNPDVYRLVDYETLAALDPKMRPEQVLKACELGHLRYPNVKAKCIIECFEKIQKMGGPAQAKSLLLAESGKDAKMQFLDKLPGIGPKYARNLMMDVYHPEFRDCIAIDSRIKRVSKSLGLSFNSYDEHERFYLDVAHRAGIEGWELDRLLFALRDAIEGMLTEN